MVLGGIGAMMGPPPVLMDLEASVTTMDRHHGQTVLEAIGIVMAPHPARMDSEVCVTVMDPPHGQTVLVGGETAMARIVVLTVSGALDVTRR